jgi:hypothetical protein
MLDFVDPPIAGRRPGSGRRNAWLDEPDRSADFPWLAPFHAG